MTPAIGTTGACVWMSAGLLARKVCDRGFDCERCLLEAAVRGESTGPWSAGLEAEPLGCPLAFPRDRTYSMGHCWLQTVGEGPDATLRIGLDALAVAMIDRPRGVEWGITDRALRTGETICAIELHHGRLPLGTPVGGRITRVNDRLTEKPRVLVEDPYRDGWLLELAPEEPDEPNASAADRFGMRSPPMEAEAARQLAHLDIRRFRRRVALHLLSDARTNGRRLPNGGRACPDLRRVLGGAEHLTILRELVH